MIGPCLIVGAGFFGAVCARELTDAGIRCRVIEKRDHIGGNCYTRTHEDVGCHEHVYGPHIFHTDSRPVWSYVTRLAEFNSFINRPRVWYRDRLYSFPVNLLTLYQLFGVRTPAEAESVLQQKRQPQADQSNVEGWCLANLGEEIYETFIRGYTWKQWNRPPAELPADIIRRVPVRLTCDDNYYQDKFQGIPIGGYTAIFERLFEGIPVDLQIDFFEDRESWLDRYPLVIYTGPVDAFFDLEFGALEYRSLRFEREFLDVRDFQGNAVVNYTELEVPWTRIVEHKHFNADLSRERTLITKEFPADWAPGLEPYYPVNTDENVERFKKYRRRIQECEGKIVFGGRLAEYRYYDMDEVIEEALGTVKSLLGK
ncbi:MAG: UDP-galactopyranose mutase [Acidobacteria bacterium]|nr:UDP-galactopyranose mutase [Acidobacteriota bacterium]